MLLICRKTIIPILWWNLTSLVCRMLPQTWHRPIMPAGLAALAAFPGFGFTVPTVPSGKLVKMDKAGLCVRRSNGHAVVGWSLIRLRRNKFNGCHERYEGFTALIID
ncbi:MAG TPA: hypothetical protein VNU23_06440 [Candidatus Cybelea sp.]|nr:hypothetical protein [Candidatus Cybelea sp.]